VDLADLEAKKEAMQRSWLNNIIAETDKAKEEEAERAEQLKEDLMKDPLEDTTNSNQ